MALPAVRAVSTHVDGTGAITVAPSASHVSGDVELLFVESGGQGAATLSTAAGFVAVTGASAAYGGAGASATAGQLDVFWRRWNGTDGSPVVADTGNHQSANIESYSGVIASGNPWDIVVVGTSVDTNTGTSGTLPGGTTTVNDCLIVQRMAAALPDLDGGANFSGWTNADLANIIEHADWTHSQGNGGAIGSITAELATAGTFGNTTVTLAVAAARNAITIALKPPVTGVSVTPGAASLTITLSAPTVSVTANRTVTPGALSLVLTTSAPTVTASNNKVVVPGALTLTLGTSAPVVTVSNNQVVTPGAASLTITTAAPGVSVTANRVVTPGAASLTITTSAPVVTATANKVVTPGAASLALTMGAPFVGIGVRVTPGPLGLTLTSFAPIVTATANSIVTPGALALTLTTSAPVVTVAVGSVPGDVAITVGQTSGATSSLTIVRSVDVDVALKYEVEVSIE